MVFWFSSGRTTNRAFSQWPDVMTLGVTFHPTNNPSRPSKGHLRQASVANRGKFASTNTYTTKTPFDTRRASGYTW